MKKFVAMIVAMLAIVTMSSLLTTADVAQAQAYSIYYHGYTWSPGYGWCYYPSYNYYYRYPGYDYYWYWARGWYGWYPTNYYNYGWSYYHWNWRGFRFLW